MGKQTDIEQISKNITDEMNKAKKWIATRTAMKMRNKLIQVYDALITQFYYDWETNMYIRHDTTDVGTRDGVNLYRALQSHMGFPPRLQPSPHTIDGGIDIDAKDMKEENYGVSKDIVLDFIINKGIRFPSGFTAPGEDKRATSNLTFVSSYADSECSASGTIVEVLESIRDQLADKYMKEAKEEAKKELKLKYIRIE